MSVFIPLAELTFQGQDMSIDNGLKSIMYTESVYGCAIYKIDASILMQDEALWDSVIKDMGKNSAMLRLGIGTDGSSPTWGPWKEILLTNSSFHFTPPVMQISASGACAGFRMTENYYEKTYKDMKISEIVKKIADRNGLDADVEETKGSYWLHQCTLPDGAFIKQVLLPLAVSNSSGRSDYYFWIQNGNKLIFKPPVAGQATRTFSYSTQGVTGQYPIFDLSTHFRRVMMEDEGCLKTTGRGYDRFKKQCLTWDADDGSVKYPKLAPNTPDAPNNSSKILILNRPLSKDNRTDEVKEATEGAWSRNMHGMFRLSILTSPILDIQPTEIVQVSIKDQNGNDHFLSGNYFLYSSTQQLAGGKLETILNLERRTYR